MRMSTLERTILKNDTEARGLTLTVGGVDANDILQFTLAAGELAISVRCGHVVIASQKINSARTLSLVNEGSLQREGQNTKRTFGSS
jgi:hypothetical protein